MTKERFRINIKDIDKWTEIIEKINLTLISLIKWLLKINIIEILLFVILILFSFHVTKYFAKVSYKIGNLNFYYLEELDNDEYLAFINICNQINEEAKQNPFYKDKKVSMIFHANTTSYKFSSLFTKSSAFAYNFGKTSYIQFCESDFINNRVKSTYYKNRHQHILTEVAKHEITHAYLSYGHGLIDSILIKKWRNEGLAEQFNNCDCYDFESYIETLLDGKNIKKDKGGFEYFGYKLAIQYLHKVRNMDYYEIYKSKGLKYKKIIREIRNCKKDEVLSWYKN